MSDEKCCINHIWLRLSHPARNIIKHACLHVIGAVGGVSRACRVWSRCGGGPLQSARAHPRRVIPLCASPLTRAPCCACVIPPYAGVSPPMDRWHAHSLRAYFKPHTYLVRAYPLCG